MDSNIKVVAIGGGTGLSIFLRGLKKVTPNITAVVTVSDDGGGSGVLREDLGMLPPGDIRSCILALSNKEKILQELFQYRFHAGRLKNQNFGNLMIAAMVGISDSFEEAVKKISDIFAITGKVLPVTIEDTQLIATLKDGSQIIGESNIPHNVVKKKTSIESLRMLPENIKAFPEVLEEIKCADIIIIGPGSLYTSLIPNLLVEGLKEQIRDSKGKVVYIANLMTQLGETDNMGLKEHVKIVEKYLGEGIIDMIYANNALIDDKILSKYAIEDAYPILINDSDIAYFDKKGIILKSGDYTNVKHGYLRHNAYKLASDIVTEIG